MTLIPRSLKRGVDQALSPVVDGLIAARVNPNLITTVGTLALVAGGVAFGVGWMRVGGGLLLLSGVFDILDGRVARAGGGATKFGAFYDSTLDRLGEASIFGGIIVYFAAGGASDGLRIPAVAITVAALSTALVVSYARARAEGLGLECKVGIAQRAERILGIGLPTVVLGAGPTAWPRGSMLLGIMALVSLTGAITVVQRIVHVRRVTRVVKRRTQSRIVAPALADVSRKGKAR